MDERLIEWDAAVQQLAIRADKIDNASVSFAETDFLSQIRPPENQAIFGRRGTGKTHLLKRLYEEYREDFAIHKTIPIAVNGSELRHDAAKISDDAAASALALYVPFVDRLVTQLHEFVTKHLDPSMLDRLFGGGDTEKLHRAGNIVTSLRSLITLGEVRLLPAGDASDRTETLRETARQSSAAVNVSLSDPRNLGWKASAGVAASKEAKQSSIRLREIEGDIILPFAEVSARIQELLALLDGASLAVLFDEWSDISAETTKPQPYLADMLKRTMASVRGMHVKLACIPGRTQLATYVSKDHPIPVGYELGDDITDVDLDTAVYVHNDLQDFFRFYTVLLQRHVGSKLPWVAAMTPGRFGRFLTTHVVDGPGVFSEICQASAGVPRDFLALVREANALRARGEGGTLRVSPRGKIKMLHVRRAAHSVFVNKQGSFAHGSPELRLLDTIYREIVAPRKTYLFLVSDSYLDDFRIRGLWTERLIHRLPPTHYDPHRHIHYRYFQIDYGKLVDLMQSEGAEADRRGAEVLAALIPDASASDTNGATRLIAILFAVINSTWARSKALATNPAGDLEPNPDEIVVPDSAFAS